MSKKHFVALAEAMKAEMPGKNWDANKAVQWQLDCKAIADVCHQFSPAFNRERFLAACGLEV